MWVFSDTEDGKTGKLTKWLTPEKTYQFGRSEVYGNDIWFEHKSVSKIHFKFIVGSIDQTKLHDLDHFTPLSIEFLSDKTTRINGDAQSSKIRSSEDGLYEIIRTTNLISLNRSQANFYLCWVPVNVLLSQQKYIENGIQHKPIDSINELITEKNLDIKISLNLNRTTHYYSLVAKGSSNKLLYSLARQIPIVGKSFFDYINEHFVAISADFKNFPRDQFERFLPLQVENSYDNQNLLPNPARSVLLKNMMFVSFNESQFTQLQGLVALLGGRLKFISLREPLGESPLDEASVVGSIRQLQDEYGQNLYLLKVPVMDTLSNKSDFLLKSEIEPKISMVEEQVNSSDPAYQDLLYLNRIAKDLGIGLTNNSDLTNSVIHLDIMGIVKSSKTRKLEVTDTKRLKRRRLNPVETSEKNSDIDDNSLQQSRTIQLNFEAASKIVNNPNSESEGGASQTRKIVRRPKVIQNTDNMQTEQRADSQLKDEPLVDTTVKKLVRRTGNFDLTSSQRPREDYQEQSKVIDTSNSQTASLPSDEVLEEVIDDSDPESIDPSSQLLSRQLISVNGSENHPTSFTDPNSKNEEQKDGKENKPAETPYEIKPFKPKVPIVEALTTIRAERIAKTREELGIFNDEDEDIMALRDLCIIEKVDFPLRKRNEAMAVVKTWNSDWNGRKNFKKFKKAGKVNRTMRGYVDLVDYDPNVRVNFGFDDGLDRMEDQVRNWEKDISRDIGNELGDVRVDGLFVREDESDEEETHTNRNIIPDIRRPVMGYGEDEDSSSDEDRPRFKLQ